MSNTKKLSLSFSEQVMNIPTPSSISYMWNFGSLLGICLMVQIVSGFFLSMHYESSMYDSFDSVVSICNDVNWGWLLRIMHANGASAFFICIYMHVGRGLYYGSYGMIYTWIVGVIIIFVLMATGFLGYVLPWGQMSFWGATVITNLLSAIPYIGELLVQWLWGGFSVSSPTLIRFFSLHFILPFFILVLVLIHLMFLHSTGSSNPLGVSSDSFKVHFHPYFIIKDLVGFILSFFILLTVVLIYPDIFMDPDNFSLANPMNTPPHIQPEWYFLFAYAVLRSIPNKLGGVIALVMSIMILLILPFITDNKINPRFNPIMKTLFWFQVVNFLMLTWIGSMPVEFPFVTIGQVVSVMYFIIFIMIGFGV